MVRLSCSLGLCASVHDPCAVASKRATFDDDQGGALRLEKGRNLAIAALKELRLCVGLSAKIFLDNSRIELIHGAEIPDRNIRAAFQPQLAGKPRGYCGQGLRLLLLIFANLIADNTANSSATDGAGSAAIGQNRTSNAAYRGTNGGVTITGTHAATAN